VTRERWRKTRIQPQLARGQIVVIFQQPLKSMAEFQSGTVVRRALPLPPYEAVMIWHDGLKNHPAHRWLRRQILDTVTQIRN
jgi:hypothetical protein